MWSLATWVPRRPPDDFGPLAVVHATGGLQASSGPGQVDIGDNCVTLTGRNGYKFLLVWHVHEEGWGLRWNEEKREIRFASPGDPSVTIRDDDIITLGGAPVKGNSPVAPVLEWLAAPHENCTADDMWAVSSVSID